MRRKKVEQLPIPNPSVNHDISREYDTIASILDKNPEIYDLAYEDLTDNKTKSKAGAKGMTAEQVVKAAIIMKKEGYTYRELAFHIKDSNTFRNFCHIDFGNDKFKKSTLNKNIKSLSPSTWEKINQCLISYANKNGLEKGRSARCDCTPVNTNIHEPKDSDQLFDCVRVLTIILLKVLTLFPGLDLICKDHRRRAKRRVLGILNAKNKKTRNDKYKDLLKVTKTTVGYAQKAIQVLEKYDFKSSIIDSLQAKGFAVELKHYVELALKVIDQTERRIIHGEKVPASEKIFSIFEPHTDIIIKDNREIHYGHKICITGGKSNMILDCVILEGNPADSTLTNDMLDRQNLIYGRYPLKASFDGGFTSRDNLTVAKAKGIKDVCFAKGRGLKAEEMCSSESVYKKMRNFRAGIESGISWLKRSFGLSVCNWKGFESFKSYVWSSVVALNLTIIARLSMN